VGFGKGFAVRYVEHDKNTDDFAIHSLMGFKPDLKRLLIRSMLLFEQISLTRSVQSLCPKYEALKTLKSQVTE
jgi:hypothetical protein